MQITLDSSEPLERVLTVVGALYSVELSIGGGERAETTRARPADQQPATASDVRSRSTASNRRTRSGRRGRIAAATTHGRSRVNQSLVRAWAQEQGLQVSTRGPLPKSVIDAYQAAAAA